MPLKISENTIKKLEQKQKRHNDGQSERAESQELRLLYSLNTKGQSNYSKSDKITQAGTEGLPRSELSKSVDRNLKTTLNAPKEDIMTRLARPKSPLLASKSIIVISKAEDKMNKESTKNETFDFKMNFKMPTEPDALVQTEDIPERMTKSTVKKSPISSDFYTGLLHRQFGIIKSKVLEVTDVKNELEKDGKSETPLNQLLKKYKPSETEPKTKKAETKANKPKPSTSSSRNTKKASQSPRAKLQETKKMFTSSVKSNEKVNSPFTEKSIVSKSKITSEIKDFKDIFDPISHIEGAPKDTDMSVDLESSMQMSRYRELAPKSTVPDQNEEKDNLVLTDRSKDYYPILPQFTKQLTSSEKNPSLASLDEDYPNIKVKAHPLPKRCIIPRLNIAPRSSDDRSLDGSKTEGAMNSLTDRFKFLEVRQENKAFMDLLQKLNNNETQDPEVGDVMGKDEEALLKDIIDYINNRNSYVHNREIDSYRQRIAELEQKLQYAHENLNSFNSLTLRREDDEDYSSREGSLFNIDHYRSKSVGRVQQSPNYPMKKSNFGGVSTRRVEDDRIDRGVLDSSEMCDPTKIRFIPERIVTNEKESGQCTPILGALASPGNCNEKIIFEVSKPPDPESLTKKLFENTSKMNSDAELRFSINAVKAEETDEDGRGQKQMDLLTVSPRFAVISPAFTLGEMSPRKEIPNSVSSNSISSPNSTNRVHTGHPAFSETSQTNLNTNIMSSGSLIQLKMPIIDSKLEDPPLLSSLLNPTSILSNLEPTSDQSNLMTCINNLKIGPPPLLNLSPQKSISMVPALNPILDTKLGLPPLLYNLLSPKSKKKMDDSPLGKTKILDTKLGPPPLLPSNLLAQISSVSSGGPGNFANRLAGLAGLTFRPPMGGGGLPSIVTLAKIKKRLKPVFIEKLDAGALKGTIYGE